MPMNAAPPRNGSRKAVMFKRLNLRVLVGMVLALAVLALVGQAIRQGMFEPHSKYTLTATRTHGIRSGVALEYAGFPIGRVENVSLDNNGQVRIHIRVNADYTRWVRADSQFALEQPILGAPHIVVNTPPTREPELPNGAVRELRVSKQMDEVMAKGMAVADELKKFLSAEGSLRKTIDHVEALTGAMKTKGMLRPMLGDEKAAAGLLSALEQTARVTRELQQTLVAARGVTGEAGKAVGEVGKAAGNAGQAAAAAKQAMQTVDATVQDARTRLLGPDGTVAGLEKALVGVQANLAELQKTLANTARISGDAADATQGLSELRARVDSITRNVDAMVSDLRRLGIFSTRDGEAKLP